MKRCVLHVSGDSLLDGRSIALVFATTLNTITIIYNIVHSFIYYMVTIHDQYRLNYFRVPSQQNLIATYTPV